MKLRMCMIASLTVALASCSWFDDLSPEIVRVVIEGDAGESVLVVTSTSFFATTNEDGDVGVEVLSSDTTVASLPFEQSWNIEDVGRFLLLAFPSDPEGADVRLQVFIDEELDFDRSTTVLPDDPARYLYLFNQPVLTNFDLL